MRSSGAQVKARRNCFDTHKWSDDGGKIWLTCHICKAPIDPARDAWEGDHIIPVTLGGSDEPTNVYPAHDKCHMQKTKGDVSRNAKAKRNRDKNYGIKRKGWSTKYRKRMDGTVELK